MSVLALAIVVPAKARAIEVTLPPGGTVIVLTDPSGVNNSVRLSKSTDGLHIFITDTAAGSGTPPPGCTSGSNGIDCPSTGVTGITARLGAGRDQLAPFSLGIPLPLTVDGGPGNDTFEGGPRADRFTGGTGNDTFRGESGRDLLFGQGGNDRLAGGRDEDKLSCGKGKRDKGVGGPGQDTLSGCEDEQS